MTTYVPVTLSPERETEKAYYVEISSGYAGGGVGASKYAWLPKSVCGEVETVEYPIEIAEGITKTGSTTYIRSVAAWWARQNGIRA